MGVPRRSHHWPPSASCRPKLPKNHEGPSQGCPVTLDLPVSGLRGWPGWPRGAPASSTLSSRSLPEPPKGAEPREAIPGEEVGRQPIVTGPWNSPVRTPRETGPRPRCPEWVAVRTRAGVVLPGPGFPWGAGQGSARRALGGNVTIKIPEVAVCEGQGDQETETGREDQGAPRLGWGWGGPSAGGSPSSAFSPVGAPTLEGNPGPPPRTPSV